MMEIDNSPEIIEALQKSHLFSSLSSKQLNQLLPLFKIKQHEANEIIIYENDIPIDLYIILEGTNVQKQINMTLKNDFSWLWISLYNRTRKLSFQYPF